MKRTGQLLALSTRSVAALAALALGLVPLIASSTAQAADPALLTQFCKGGLGFDAAGQCYGPLGVAADPASGNIYVNDYANRRVEEFTPYGEFLRAWGWGVVASGPGNKPRNERQELVVDATAGNFSLRYVDIGIHTTTPIAFDASAAEVQNALAALSPSVETAVSGPDGGPWTIEYVGAQTDADITSHEGTDGLVVVNSTLSGGAASATVKTIQQGANFEICVPAQGDVCQAGYPGTSPGQFNGVQQIAVDSGGDVYLADNRLNRVQKFDSEGHFLLMFGAGVNQGGGTPSNPGNICTADNLANGDVCGAGTAGTGPGEFSSSESNFLLPIAIDPATDTIYVGDKDRIEKFDAAGNYTGQIALPEAGRAALLALDTASGDLYFAYGFKDLGFPLYRAEQPDVYRLDASSGAVLDTLEVPIPNGLATDAAGNVYAYYPISAGGAQASNQISRVLQFNKAGTLVANLFENQFGNIASVNLATSSACGIKGADLIVSVPFISGAGNYVNLYGPPPDPAVCPPPTVPPTIEDTYAVSATTDSATVKATINPHFWPDTRYYVQYGTGKCSEGGCDQVRPGTPGPLLTSKVLDASVDTAGVFLPGLSPDTTYHYRFLTQSSGGGPVIGPERSFHTFPTPTPPPNPDPCPNAAFRSGFSARLPDCRAYELVSPLDKNNGDVSTSGNGLSTQSAASLVQASNDGERITFSSFRAFAGAEASPLMSQYLAARDPASGWQTRSISPPRNASPYYPIGSGEISQYKAFSDDLCSGWLIEETGMALVPEAFTPVPELYRRSLCDPEGYELLTNKAPPGIAGFQQESPYYPAAQGFSASGDRSVFIAGAALTPNANSKAGIYQVYEAYDGDKLRLVSVLPNGTAATTHSTAGTPQGNVEGGFRAHSVHHAVSTDGSRVFWTASNAANPVPVNLNTKGALYLRLNATEAQSKLTAGKCTEAAKACTIAISTDPETLFLGADPQGTKAIYRIGKEGNSKLYEFDLATETSSLITEGLKGVVGMSEDSSRVYFISDKVLSAEQENSEGDKAKAGGANLYLYDAGKGSFTFVASLSSDALFEGDPVKASLVNLYPYARSARVTPDGLGAVFIAKTRLTGYDNTDANEPAQVDSEVFRYDAEAGAAGELSCVSCNPTGARPEGRVLGACIEGICHWYAATIPGWQTQTHPSHALSEDGDTVFFNSFDALLARDTNGVADVYQWEAPGSGDCTEQNSAFSAQNEGCISLISSGESPSDSEFFDASASGSDVFFLTQSALLPQDYGLRDVYVARVNGGFPQPPGAPPACEGEACQGPLAPPNDPTPGSSSYDGPGNPKAAKKKQAKKKAKKHKKKSHAKKQKSAKRAKHNGRAGR